MAETDDRPEVTVTKRLQREGRWTGPGGGEAERDRIMRELRSAGLSREEARQRCYPILDRLFPPVPEPEPEPVPEPEPEPPPQNLESSPQFVGHVGDVDELIDPDYSELDAGCRLRDSYVWVGDEFRRITTDAADGTTRQDFSRAKTRPPTPLAVSIAEYYGQHASKRGELFSRLAQFAQRQHQVVPANGVDQPPGFMGDIE